LPICRPSILRAASEIADDFQFGRAMLNCINPWSDLLKPQTTSSARWPIFLKVPLEEAVVYLGDPKNRFTQIWQQ